MANTSTTAMTIVIILALFLLNIITFLSCIICRGHRLPAADRSTAMIDLMILLSTGFLKRLGPPILGCVLILCFEIFYHRKKDGHKKAEAEKKFWDKELEANSVRKKDITFLNYIDIPLDKLPFIETDDGELTEYQIIVKTLADKRILNLSGITNTDLKLEYGPANLTELSQYDDNYTTLTSVIAKWGARLIELGMHDEAVTVLEYGISIGSDVSRGYYLLADEYRKAGRADDIDRLIATAEKLDSIMKKPILAKLREIRGYLS